MGIIKNNTIAILCWIYICANAYAQETPDFQIIKPSNKNTSTAYVAGLRTKIDF